MLQSARELFRFRMLATDGKIGKADDFYFDDVAWDVRHVVVNTGRWLPANRVLVGPECVRSPDLKARVIPVSMTKEQVIQSEGSDTEELLSYRQERLIRERYGGHLYREGGGPIGWVHGVVQRQALAVAEAERRPGAEEEKVEAKLRSIREVIGYKIEAVDGPLGGVDDFLLDDEGWRIPYIVVNTKDGRLPNPKVLAPSSWVQHMSWSETRVHLRVNREKIRRSQRYDPVSHSPLQKPKPFIWP